MRTILLAEDNASDVFLVRQALAEHHVESDLKVVGDGEAALRYVKAMGKPGNDPCPDLMVLDINLPKADGISVLAAFRQHPDCEETPVIMVSSSDSATDRRKAAALGVDLYFRKPSQLDEFMKLGEVVRAVLDKKATA
jgi:CheY-like chemotaxis protein